MRSLLLLVGVLALAAILWGILSANVPPPRDESEVARKLHPTRSSEALVVREDRAAAGGIRGTIWRGGRGVPARVEVRPTESREPTGTGLRPSATERLLLTPFARTAPLATASSGEDGAFEISGLVPGRYQVEATATDGAAGRVEIEIPAPGAIVRASPHIRSGSEMLRGRLVRVGGEPFRGLVWAVPDEGQRTRPEASGGSGLARTDEEGRFVLGRLRAGPLILVVIDPGRLRATFRGIGVPHSDEFVLTVGEGLELTTGRVVSEAEGTAVADARALTTGSVDGIAYVIGSSSGPDGRLRFLAPPCPLSFEIRAAGYVPHLSRRYEPEDLEFRLTPLSAVVGRVLSDPDGVPVPGVPVHCVPVDNSERHRLSTRAVTDANGRYTLDSVPPIEVMVYAWGSGWISKELPRSDERGEFPLAITVARGAHIELDIPVVPAARASGRVVNHEDRGVGGVPVRAAPLAGPPHRPSGMSGPDGEFRIDTLVPGFAYHFTASAGGRAPVTDGPYLANTEEPIELVLRLPPARWLSVRVVSADGGNPIPGAIVRVSRSQEKWSTGPDGSVHLGPTRPGDLSVWAHHPAYVRLRRWQTVADPGESEPPASVVVTLTPAHMLAGRVVLPHGPRVTDGVVRVETSRRSLAGASVIYGDGSFRIGGLATGSYRLVALGRADGRIWTADETVETGREDLVITVRDQGLPPEPTRVPGRRFRVRVIDAEGRPVASGTVALVRGFAQRDMKLGGGFAELRPLPVGRGDFFVRVLGARDAEGRPLAATRFGPVSPAADEVVIRMTRGLLIHGLVQEEDGSPIPGIRLHAMGAFTEPDGNEARHDYHAQALTDREGRFELTGLGDAAYQVKVEVPARFQRIADVVVPRGSAEVVIRLVRAASALVTVLDLEDRPIPGAEVSLSAPSREVRRGGVTHIRGGGSRREKTDGAGSARVGHLPPDTRYRVVVKPPESRPELAEIVLRGWLPEDTIIRLAPGLVVSGHVRFVPARSMGRVKIWCRTADGAYRIETLPSDGRFRFEQLPPGPARLWLRTDGSVGFPYLMHQLEIAAGTEDTEFVIPLGHRLQVVLTGWPGGNTVGKWVPLHPDGSEDRDRIARVRLGPTLTYEGLLPDARYSLIVCGVGGELCAQLNGVRGDAGRVALALVPGETISGRLVLPAGAGKLRVTATARGLTVSGRVGPDGVFAIGGLIPGTWSVRGHAEDDDGEIYGGSLEVLAGEEIVLPLSTREE